MIREGSLLLPSTDKLASEERRPLRITPGMNTPFEYGPLRLDVIVSGTDPWGCSEEQCNRCSGKRRPAGPWRECVSMKTASGKLLQGSCANCHYGGSGSYCSWRFLVIIFALVIMKCSLR
jgi:hypothetical protein